LYLGCIVSTTGFPYPDWWVVVWVLGAGAVLGQQTQCGGEPDLTIPLYLRLFEADWVNFPRSQLAWDNPTDYALAGSFALAVRIAGFLRSEFLARK
jgi:hypothetical protein